MPVLAERRVRERLGHCRFYHSLPTACPRHYGRMEHGSGPPKVVEADLSFETPQLLGPPEQGDGTCRGGYGVSVAARYGALCAYCDRDLGASYEAWLDLSVDHVVPRNAIKVGVPEAWIEDLLNHVTCCRACNEFLNGFRIAVTPPSDLGGFAALRQEVLAQKRDRSLSRHRLEREKFAAWIAKLPS